VEFSFAEPVAPAASTFAASTFQSSLIQTIDTSQFSPPSSDPAGVTYLNSSNTLLVSDSEINEIPIFTGDNLFEMTLRGVLSNTLTTISFSDEPTGVTLNPSNGHLFFSDDTAVQSVYELNPGPDGLYDTPDDIITSFVTSDFGSYDPEGVTFASALGALFISDGVNEEVYQVTPGANGLFDGVPPAGDDQVTSFDTSGLGLRDPEGIAFNSDNGNLYVVGRPPNTLFEVTTGGVLVQTIDISAANAIKPAGLAYAPASLDPNVMNIYITDRGVDEQNDGKVYEMTLQVAQAAPVADFSGTPQSGDAPLDVSFTDLSTNIPTSWSWDFGDGVTSNEQNPAHTYSAPGGYTVTLTVSNTLGGDTEVKPDYITVTKPPPAAEFTGSPTTGAAPLTVSFSDLSSGDPTAWAWDFGDGATSNEQNSVHTYTAPGSYTVTLTASNTLGGDIEVKQDYITVTEPPSVAEFTGSPTTGAAPLTVSFSDLSSSTPTTWAWDFGDGATSNEQNPVHTYSAPGSYTVALTVSNTLGGDTEVKPDYISVTWRLYVPLIKAR
jgi:PKD repeat protein